MSDGKVTNTEWAGIATGLLASLGAYLVPNSKAPAVDPTKFVASVSAPSNVNAAAPVTTTSEPLPPLI